jgi:ubiquinone/menaquinone biosynthesis C-methylase UbiE
MQVFEFTHKFGLDPREARVFAVEPNSDMRVMAEEELSGHSGFVSVNAAAEQTGLADKSIDLITVAQAFHWFDQGQFQLECRRILRSDAKVVLVWNSRDEESPLVKEIGMVCRKFCPEYKGFSGGLHKTSENFRQFFRDGTFESRVFQNDLVNSKESFVGGMMSSSYSPKQNDPEYQAFVDAILLIFEKYSCEDRLIIPNMTRSYVGLV